MAAKITTATTINFGLSHGARLAPSGLVATVPVTKSLPNVRSERRDAMRLTLPDSGWIDRRECHTDDKGDGSECQYKPGTIELRFASAASPPAAPYEHPRQTERRQGRDDLYGE